jgi:putative flippase GtrA
VETTVLDPTAQNVTASRREPVELSVIVPTRNNVANLPGLLERLGAAVGGTRAEVVVVDDSDEDATPALLRQVRGAGVAHCPIPVRLLRRAPGQRRGGRSGAVVAGTRCARGTWTLVLHADLRHPPEAAGILARIALRHDVDVVVATRYAGTVSGFGEPGAGRTPASSAATRAAKALFPRRLATVSDPMSGLFAFRTAAVDLERLNPLSIKLLLEILVRHPALRVAEVSYELPGYADIRATLREGVTLLRQLVRLRRQRLVSQMRQGPRSRALQVQQLLRMVMFGVVGLSGVVVNTATLGLLYHGLGLNHLVGATLATQASTAWNFLLLEALVYRRNRNGTRLGRYWRFALMNNTLLLARLPVLEALVWSGMEVLWANALTLIALFLVRFVISDRVIYSAAGESNRDPVRVLVDAGGHDKIPVTRRRLRHLPYRYDIAGVVTIGSQILLPELEFFRAQWVSDGEVDIAVRVGDVGSRHPHRRAAMTEYANTATLRYEEHLGRLGANFRVELGEPVSILVGPLLARSPHVVYTNVIEALLRFVMVSRDRMLLHSACVSLDGVGVMLSALTDTGKTATVLRLLRDHGGLFLSDDMTVVDRYGTATCFPKPLTISAHTLRAVQAQDLTPKEWRRLRLQSRLHSKGGRSMALTLSRLNLPIMGINAITQMLVPPPKYMVDRLVPCRLGRSTRVDELFIIERGRPGVRELDHAGALTRMIENTDDAYGFPPFKYLAPAVTVAGKGYAELRALEREILSAFLAGVRTRVVGSDNFGWADEIPRLIQPAPSTVDGGGTVAGRHAVDTWPRWREPVEQGSVA